MKDFLLGLLDWIYKKKCYFCKSTKECVKMCSDCFDKLEHLPIKINRVIEKKPIYCCGVYSKDLQKLIRGLKYHNQKDLAYFQAKFMYEYWKKVTSENNFQIVPVPLHLKRQKTRKYNHMILVAQEFCKLSGNCLNIDLIQRTKNTRPQYSLSKKERAINLSGAFKIDASKIIDAKILLIDDICTTGSTFEEIIKEFKKHNIIDIMCLATATPFEE